MQSRYSIFICASFLVLVALLFQAARSASPQQRGDQTQEEREDVQAREEWFYSQRAYPFGTIPPDARRKAWESRPRDSVKGKREAVEAQTWQSIGPVSTVPDFSQWGLLSGRVNAIAISPADPQIVLIGSADGGIWRSTDGGQHFIPVSDNLLDATVASIAFSKSNPQIVYAAMSDRPSLFYLGHGVIKSTDGGQTWVQVSSNSTLPSTSLITRVAVDQANSSRVYVAMYGYQDPMSGQCCETGGIFVSTDGGVTWVNTFNAAATDLIIHPANPQILYAGFLSLRESKRFYSGASVARSTDGGLTWVTLYSSPVSTDFDCYLAISSVNPQLIYAYSGGFDGVRLAASSDGGTNWNAHTLSDVDKGGFSFNSYIVTDPGEVDTVYIGSRDIFRSINRGVTFRNLTGNFSSPPFSNYTPNLSITHPDQHVLAFSPSNSAIIYIGNDGGAFKSTDSGRSFESQNATLALTQFYGYALDPADATRSYGGTQDNGVQMRTPGTEQWNVMYGGDGGHCVVDPLDPSIMFTTSATGAFLMIRWVDYGAAPSAAFTASNFGNDSRSIFIPPLSTNGVDAALYYGTYRLWVSTDLGNHWSAPGGATDLTRGITSAGADGLMAIGVARSAYSSAQVIYTGSSQGRAMVSINGGQTWTDISSGLPNRSITSIRVGPGNPATAYITVSGFLSGHVFKTTDTGASWTDLSGNLPDIPTNDLLIDRLNSNTLYIGTDIGVFRSTTGGNTWTSFNDGMPPVVVNHFDAQANGLIHVATYGRGAYMLPPITNQIDTASFFVHQHYIDFLNRMPDQSGLDFWTNEITSCGTDQQCIDLKRINVSAAFFLSIEFQQTGYLVERIYKIAYGSGTGTSTLGGTHQLPVPVIRLNEFLPDTQEIGQGVIVGQPGWETVLDNNKQAFTSEFVQRSRFSSTYPTSLTPALFVDTLFANAGVTPTPTERTAAISEFGSATTTGDTAARARALRRVAENSTLATQESNSAFVLMQYFGYLRRNPNDQPDSDYTGYDFWLTKLNQFNGNFINAEMVKAFISSIEYRQRFGP